MTLRLTRQLRLTQLMCQAHDTACPIKSIQVIRILTTIRKKLRISSRDLRLTHDFEWVLNPRVRCKLVHLAQVDSLRLMHSRAPGVGWYARRTSLGSSEPLPSLFEKRLKDFFYPLIMVVWPYEIKSYFNYIKNIFWKFLFYKINQLFID